MISLAIIGVLWLKSNFATGSSQQAPQVLPLHTINPQQIPVQYGAYLQQLDTAGAQVLPVQHSVTVNHSPYTFYPKPQVFYPPPLPPLNQYNALLQPKLDSENPKRPLNVQQLNNRQPIQFLSKTPQYTPQQIQLPLKPNPEGIQIINPPNLGHVQYNNIPAHGKIPQGHPPVQPYISQGEKFRQQISGKLSPNKPNEEKHLEHYQDQKRPSPQPVRHQPQIQERRRKDEEEENEKERDEQARQDSEEESEEEDESGEEYGSEEEEEDSQDEKGAASDLPPKPNRSKYDFDNRNYRPTFDAAKYIFDEREQSQKKSVDQELPRYHKEKGFKYAYHKNTKSTPKQEPQRERSRFAFYDSEPKFNRYEPTFEPNEPIFEPHQTPRRVKAKRVEITNGKPTYYYSSTDPKPNNNNNNKVSTSKKDSNPQATRKKMVREKWFVVSKET